MGLFTNTFRRGTHNLRTSDAGPASARDALHMQPREFAALAANTMADEFHRLVGMRSGVGRQYDGLRDVQKVCGYAENLTWQDYWDTYDRFELAGRIVEAYPSSTFTQAPSVIDRLTGEETKFELQMNGLLKHTPMISSYLQRLDILAGIGQYAIMLMGVDDGLTLETPMNPNRKNKITYLRPFKQGDIAIVRWEDSLYSPRYGRPTLYQVKLQQPTTLPGTLQHGGTVAMQEYDVFIHHSRVIHFADNLLENDVFGTSRLHRVYNRLADALKIVSGSAEMFWRGAYQGMAFETDAEAQIDDATREKMKTDIEQYLLGLTRQILLQGTKARSLAPNITSPSDHFDVIMTMIAVAAKMPKRILMGTEQGKLASTQDLHTWNRSVEERRHNTAEPRLVRAVVEWCIVNKVVDPPVDGTYKVKWPPLAIPDEAEKAKVSVQYTDALASYIGSKAHLLMKFDVYLQKVWGLPQKEAEALAKDVDYSKLDKLDASAAKKSRDNSEEWEDRNAPDPKGAV